MELICHRQNLINSWRWQRCTGSELSRDCYPIGRVSALLRSVRPDIDYEIIKAYSTAVLFYSRLNGLNAKLMLKEKQQERRKAVH